MAQSIAAMNTTSKLGVSRPLNSFNSTVNFNSLPSSFPIIHSNPRRPQFSIQCAGGVFPSIIKGAENWFYDFTRRFTLPKLNFLDYLAYLEICRDETSRFAVDEYNRRENKALKLERILKSTRKDSAVVLYTFELETTDERGCRRVYHAVVRLPLEGKKQLLEFCEVGPLC